MPRFLLWGIWVISTCEASALLATNVETKVKAILAARRDGMVFAVCLAKSVDIDADSRAANELVEEFRVICLQNRGQEWIVIIVYLRLNEFLNIEEVHKSFEVVFPDCFCQQIRRTGDGISNRIINGDIEQD